MGSPYPSSSQRPRSICRQRSLQNGIAFDSSESKTVLADGAANECHGDTLNCRMTKANVERINEIRANRTAASSDSRQLRASYSPFDFFPLSPPELFFRSTSSRARRFALRALRFAVRLVGLGALLVRIATIVGLVEARALEHDRGAGAEQAAQFRFAALRALFFGDSVID